MIQLRIYLVVFFLLAKTLVHAQWIALPSATFMCSVGYPSLPLSIIPIGDGQILFTTYCLTNHAGITEIYLSSDNLVKRQRVYSNAPLSYGTTVLSNLDFHGDSIFTYAIFEKTRRMFYLTLNTFKSRVSFFQNYYIGNPISSGVTQNYIYLITEVDKEKKIFRSDRSANQVWEQKFTEFNPLPNKLRFINDSVGYVLVNHVSNPSKSSLMRLTSFGTNWVPILMDSIDNIVDFQITSTNKMFALKKSGAILKSINNGASFESIVPVASGTYSCLHFANDSIGFVGGLNGVLMKTTDAGSSWSIEVNDSKQAINSIYTYKKYYYFKDVEGNLYAYQNEATKFEDPKEEYGFEIYPNPASENITVNYISSSGLSTRLEVVDAIGKKVLEFSFENKLDLSVSSLSAGLYFLRISEGDKIIKTHKLLVLREQN